MAFLIEGMNKTGKFELLGCRYINPIASIHKIIIIRPLLR
jgi:hypothetical protein